MKYLNLDTSFTPFGKSINFESFVFNGGEPHIKILEKLTAENELTITTRIRSFNDVGMLLIATDALRRMEVENIHLVIPYFPAARQDRLMIKGEPLSVKVYTEILNAQNLHKITVFDAHSEVTPALLNNCENVNNHSFIEKICEQLNDDLLLIKKLDLKAFRI
mgnify:CR=1 FL=1